MEDMGRWIAEQRVPENILYVVQTGDMVDNGFVPKQWDIFDECYNQFKDDIPYFAIAGNHDIGVKLQDYSAYLARPNVSSIPRRNSFERGRAVYATFEAGGTKFLLLGAGWQSEEMSVDWMNQVLKEYKDSVAVLIPIRGRCSLSRSSNPTRTSGLCSAGTSAFPARALRNWTTTATA